MTWLVVLASVAAYLWIGHHVAGRCAKRYAAFHERQFPYLTRDKPDSYRRESQAVGGLGGLLWPVLLVAWVAVMALARFAGTPPRFPSEIEHERDQMQQRIAELERELGVGR